MWWQLCAAECIQFAKAMDRAAIKGRVTLAKTQQTLAASWAIELESDTIYASEQWQQ